MTSGIVPTSSVVFAGRSEMAERCRVLEWGLTPLGVVESWPAGMRSIANLALESAFPTMLLFGPALVIIHNDAFTTLFAPGSDGVVGLAVSEAYAERWEADAPAYNYVWQGGSVSHADTTHRFGGVSGGPIRVGLSPVRDDVGTVCGIIATLCDLT